MPLATHCGVSFLGVCFEGRRCAVCYTSVCLATNWLDFKYVWRLFTPLLPTVGNLAISCNKLAKRSRRVSLILIMPCHRGKVVKCGCISVWHVASAIGEIFFSCLIDPMNFLAASSIPEKSIASIMSRCLWTLTWCRVALSIYLSKRGGPSWPCFVLINPSMTDRPKGYLE